MKVMLLTNLSDLERNVAFAARLCYMSDGTNPIEYLEKMPKATIHKQINLLANVGHESPIEHAQVTFYIEGVSRVLLAQLTRHRHASYSVQSQRYVKLIGEDGMDMVIKPPAIAENEEANAIFVKSVTEAIDAYNKIADILSDKYFNELIADVDEEVRDSELYRKQMHDKAEKLAIEDARYVLPQAIKTRLEMSMNARSLKNFFALRCCNRAQWEIRELATAMYTLCVKEAPYLFSDMGPSCCSRSGRCSEGHMSCGKMKDVQEKFKRIRMGK